MFKSRLGVIVLTTVGFNVSMAVTHTWLEWPLIVSLAVSVVAALLAGLLMVQAVRKRYGPGSK